MEVEISEGQLVVFDLKYCERCGGLWLRLEGNEEVYCPSCIPKMAELPVVRRRRKRSELQDPEELRVERIEELMAFCSLGGNA
jgi:hypothetical protein